MRIFAGLTAAAIVCTASPVAAQMVEAEYDEVLAAMKVAGYDGQVEGSDGSRFITSSSDGIKFAIFFFGCDSDGENCKSVQLYASFSAPTAPTLEQMNKYAREKRWGRVYLDTSGDPVIEMDIDLEDGGMSQALFVDNLEYWDVIMKAFAAWLNDPS